jgi:hypothetical protein
MLSQLAKMSTVFLSLSLMYLKDGCNMLLQLLKPEEHNAH